MKEDKIKKLIVRSELRTKPDFTDELMLKIDPGKAKENSVNLWSVYQIFTGFFIVVLIFGFLIFRFSAHFQTIRINSLFINIPLAFLLLWCLDHLYFINRIANQKNIGSQQNDGEYRT